MSNAILFLIVIPCFTLYSFFIGYKASKRRHNSEILDLSWAVSFIFISGVLFFFSLMPFIGIPAIIKEFRLINKNDSFQAEIIDIEIKIEEDKKTHEEKTMYYPIVKAIVGDNQEVIQKLNLGSSTKPIIGDTEDVIYDTSTNKLYLASLAATAMRGIGLFFCFLMIFVNIYALMYAFGTTISPETFASALFSFFMLPVMYSSGIIVTSYFLYLCFIAQKYNTLEWNRIITATIFLVVLISTTPSLIKHIREAKREILT